MKKSTRSNLFVVSLLFILTPIGFLQAQSCFLSRIIEADGDTVSILYNESNHISSIAKKSTVKTNPSGFITEIIHDQSSAAGFSKATFNYDNNNNLILYEQFDPANTVPSFRMKFIYNSFNQLTETKSDVLVGQNYFYGYRIFVYPNTTTRNPSTIKTYSGDAHGKTGSPDETIALTYDDKKTIGYINPLDDFNPFTTNNVITATVVEVGVKPKTEIFTYQYNSFGYPISKSEKEGERIYVTSYFYTCK